MIDRNIHLISISYFSPKIKRFGKNCRKICKKSIYKSIFGFSIWVTVSSLAQRLIFNITPSVLGIVASTAAIAVFGVITTIEGYTYTFTTAINGMFMPKISRIVAKDESRHKLSELLLSVGKFQYALNGLIIVGFATVGSTFINLWVGSDYHMAYYGILLVIIPGLFFNSLQIANTTLVVENKVRLQAIVSVIAGVTNILLSFPLSKKFGVLGACISICIAYMLRSVIINIISYKVLKLDIPNFIKKCYLRMSLPIILSIAAGIALNTLLTKESWLYLILKAIIVVIVYIISTALIGLEKNDRQQIKNLVMRK